MTCAPAVSIAVIIMVLSTYSLLMTVITIRRWVASWQEMESRIFKTMEDFDSELEALRKSRMKNGMDA